MKHRHRPSALEAAVTRVGDRWTLLIVEALLGGPARFKDLEGTIDGIATNILSKRLKHLEREGIVIPRLYSERPPRVEYTLSAMGQDLAGALRLLSFWGARNSDAEAPRHEACGTPMEPRWHCPTCEREVTDDDPDLRYF